MLPIRHIACIVSLSFAVLLCLGSIGCQHGRHRKAIDPTVPTEAARVSHPPYTIEPPDILLINAGNLVPLPPYHIGSLDVLSIRVTRGEKREEVVPGQPIDGLFAVSPEGKVDLGFSFGTVAVAGLTLEEARTAVERSLSDRFKAKLYVNVDLAQSNQAIQQIRGEHLVRPDGTIGLGIYGSVFVDTLTLSEAKAVIELHLSKFLQNPKISLDVSGFNSKVYYVISDLAGSGQKVYRLPLTGKETVLDAISQVYGLTPVSTKQIWVARPGASQETDQTLQVDWNGVTQNAHTATNYQLMAGDRVYVQGAPLVAADTYLQRILSPFERILGITLLGSSTVNSIAHPTGFLTP